MRTVRLLGLLGLCIGLSVVARPGQLPAADDKHDHDMHAEHFDTCAKACTDCARMCESCAHHCAHMLAEGKKEHLLTLGTCTDCAEFCVMAAKVVAHRGPMAFTACEACAKACDTCGTACEKFPNDKHMTECAKACRDCAKACREMLKHAKHIGGSTTKGVETK
jgi:triphosphoribosyl-dephospho-CoA synthetase